MVCDVARDAEDKDAGDDESGGAAPVLERVWAGLWDIGRGRRRGFACWCSGQKWGVSFVFF